MVDLDDQSFILFNYAQDDLSNPTIVKNSFSQQITLKGTANNNRIFGHYFKTDRRITNTGGETGTDFNASQKTPFTIYNEMGEILQSGYVKLDSISRKGADIQYKVSLFGGLGSFLFSLSYDEEGNKRTLADLDYLGGGDPTELDFTIKKESVLDAWDVLQDLFYGASPTPTGKWTIINFAPAYNGIPDNFSADKGLLSLPGAGLPAEKDGYSARGGYGLVNLANPQDEWAVKDLRSYLQRPVLSMRAFLNAICNPANNGGYVVDITDISNTNLFPYYDLWMTLPTIPSLGSTPESGGTLSLDLSSSASTSNEIGRYDIVGDVPFGSVVFANIRSKIRMNMPEGANSYNSLPLIGNDQAGQVKFSLLFLQMVAYASDGTMIGGSGVKMVSPIAGLPPAGVAQEVGFTPAFSTNSYEVVEIGGANKVSNGVFELSQEVSLQVEAQDVAYYKLMASAYDGQGVLNQGTWHYTYSGQGGTARLKFYVDYNTNFLAASAFIVDGSGNSITKTDSSQLRSGSAITKQMLLSTSATPAEYLLSLCKMFGLYFVYDPDQRKVTILKRNSLYQDETIDLTRRVDLSKGIDIQPMVFNSKWYDFILDGVGGSFYDEYLNIEGIPYGIQRVNTGYDFNADSVNLMDSQVFKNACTILSRSKYWNIIERGRVFIPSPFVDNGNTITRWNPDGETQDTPISCPPVFSDVTYYNNTFNGFDKEDLCKVQFADADGKMVDGKDVLIFLNGFGTYDKFKVTDDLPIMSVVNGGKPCWILDAGGGVDIPVFSRYSYEFVGLTREMVHSLDFGVPRQLDIPGITYDPESTIYETAWKAYISDRYDVNTKVMTCRVDFSGIQVSQELLRKFYWYDNSIWVLNAIRNYSLTTYDPVECEFVQVQDKDNYLNGQTY